MPIYSPYFNFEEDCSKTFKQKIIEKLWPKEKELEIPVPPPSCFQFKVLQTLSVLDKFKYVKSESSW